MNSKKYVVILAIASILLTGCGGGGKLDVSEFQTTSADRAKVRIPKVCQDEYKNAIPKVAVVNFTNNSTFGKADITNTKGSSKTTKNAVGAVGIGISPVGIGAVGASHSTRKTKFKVEEAKRKVDAKVSGTVTDAVEATLAQMGGAKIYSRTDLQKILNEQKLQQSGLLSEKNLVEVGKIAGVKYIVTGSINNVKQKYIEKTDTLSSADTGNKTLNQLKTVANLAILVKNAVLSGMTVETSMTIKILDVKSAEIVFSKKVSGKSSIGDVKNPSFDQLVGGLKEAAANAIKEANADLSKYFKVRGYVVKIKSNKKDRVALINIGENMKIKTGQEFFVYSFEEVQDPISGAKSCDMTKAPLTLTASNQITRSKTWANAKGKVRFLKVGQLVERKPIENKKGMLGKLGL